MPLVLLIELPDNLVDADQKIGAIFKAALHANGKITALDARSADRNLPLSIAVNGG